MEPIEKFLTQKIPDSAAEYAVNSVSIDLQRILDKNRELNPNTTPALLIYMFLGALANLPETGIMRKLGINKILYKYEDGQIHLSYLYEQNGVSNIMFRTLDIENKFTGKEYTPEAFKEIAYELDLDIFKTAEYEIDWKVLKLLSHINKDGREILIPHIYDEPVDQLRETLNTAVRHVYADSIFNANWRPYQYYDKIETLPYQNIEAFDDMANMISKNRMEDVIQGAKYIFNQIHKSYKKYEHNFALEHTTEAYTGFTAGVFMLSMQNKQIEIEFHKTMNNKMVLKLISKMELPNAEKKLNAKIPIIAELKAGEPSTSDAEIESGVFDFMSSTETDSKNALLLSIDYASDIHNLVIRTKSLEINQGIVYKLFKNHEDLFNRYQPIEITSNLDNELRNAIERTSVEDPSQLSRYIFGQVLALNLGHFVEAKVHKFRFNYQDPTYNDVLTTFFLSKDEKLWLSINVLEKSVQSKEIQDFMVSNFIPNFQKILGNKKISGVFHIDFTLSEDSSRHAHVRKINVNPNININRVNGDFVPLQQFEANRYFSSLDGKMLRQYQSEFSDLLLHHQNFLENKMHVKALIKGLLSKDFVILSRFENKEALVAYLKPASSRTVRITDESSFAINQAVMIKCGIVENENSAMALQTNAGYLQVDYATGLGFFLNERKPELVTFVLFPHDEQNQFIRLQFDQALDLHDRGLYNYMPAASHMQCLMPQARRFKRNANAETCLFSWEDIDKFNTETDKNRDPDFIKVDSEKFLRFASTENEKKVSQLMDFLIEKGLKENDITGPEKQTAKILFNNQKVINTLSRMSRVSDSITKGMIGKNILADMLNGNYKSLEYNSLIIFANHMFPQAAHLLETKALKLAASGNEITSKILYSTSPFVARLTSAYNVYDLVESIKEYKTGNYEALVNMANDVTFLTIDTVEIGLKLAETFGMIEGGSAIFGPIGTTIGTIVFVGTDIYLTYKQVSQINNIIHLSATEEAYQSIRIFFGAGPSEYVQRLVEQKQHNNMQAENAAAFLRQHSYKNFIFPLQLLKDGKWIDSPDNNVFLVKLRKTAWDRSKPDPPTDMNILCYTEDVSRPVQRPDPVISGIPWIFLAFSIWFNPYIEVKKITDYYDNDRVTTEGFSYKCDQSIGVEKQRANSDDPTLIDLKDGNDFAIGFQESPNIFLIGNGHKNITGGKQNDVFILGGDVTTGLLNGANGSNALDLSYFAKSVTFMEINLNKPYGKVTYGQNQLLFTGMHVITGRINISDAITLACETSFVDANAFDGHRDVIIIPEAPCSYNAKISIKGTVVVKNSALHGHVLYIISNKTEKSFIYLSSHFQVLNTFVINYPLEQIDHIEMSRSDNDGPCVRICLNPNRDYYLTIYNFSTSSVAHLNDGASLYMDKSNMFYAKFSSNEGIEDLLTKYKTLAEKLGIFLVIYSIKENSTVSIGHSNKKFIDKGNFHSSNVIYNDPNHMTHIFGGNAENVYVVTSGKEKLKSISEAVLPNIIIHNSGSVFTSTIHVGKLHLQLKRDLNKDLIVETEFDVTSTKYILIKLYADKNCGQCTDHKKSDLVLIGTIRLKNAFDGNGVEKYIIVKLAPSKLLFNKKTLPSGVVQQSFELQPVPLHFNNKTKAILITVFNVERNNKIYVAKTLGEFGFLRQNDSLILTNVHLDIPLNDNNVITIIFRNFFKEPVLQSLTITFNDIVVIMEEEMKIIRNMANIDKKIEEYKRIHRKNFNLHQVFEDFLSNVNN